MMKKRSGMIAFAILSVLCFLGVSDGWAAKEKPTIIKPCKQCHTPQKDMLRGKLGGVSMKAETLQVSIGPATWLVSFDDETELVGAKAFNMIKKGKEVAVDLRKDGDLFYATRVRVKPPAAVSPEKLITVERLAKLVEEGPEKGAFTLVDARPGKRYHEGHIPGSLSIYDAKFDKNVAKLPKDKSRLLIFYCGGPT